MFDFKQALQLNPKDAKLINCLAWMLATHPEDEYRDSRRTQALAQQVLAISGTLIHGDITAPWPQPMPHQATFPKLLFIRKKPSK